MADAKISQLTALTTAADDDLLAIVDTSATETKKIAKSDLVAGLQAELVSGTNIKTINSTSLLGSGDITISGGGSPAGTAGQIQFSDGSAFAADSNLFWDNTNKRLGVGTNSPNAPIEVYAASPTIATKIVSNGTAKFAFLSGSSDEMGSLSITGSSGESRWETKTSYFPTIYSSGQEVVRINTSQQMGIGTPSPTARLHVKGTGSTSATTALLVQNSSGTDLLKVRDDGRVELNSNSFFSDTGTTLKIGTNGNTRLQVTSSSISPWGGENLGISNSLNSHYGNVYSKGVTHITDNTTSSTTLEASAKLQADSTTQGFLPPRMTTTQKNAISTPAAGLQLYDSTTSRPCVYTTAWESLTSSDSASPTAVYKFWSGTAAQYAALTPDANTVYFVS